MAMAEITTEVPHGTARRFDLRTGDLIRIETLDGAQGGDFSFPGFDQALTRNKLGWKRFGRPWLVYDAQAGDSLFDVDGEATFELIALEGEGVADIMYPGCWDEVYEDRRPGCQDLISAALTIPRRDLAGMLSFFIGYSADNSAYRGLAGIDLKPGDHLTFRALRDVSCAVSACPDRDIPGWRVGALFVSVTEAGK
ncbi:MAG TPA: DUF1989 domain-containing protein [Solirubrobacterales bacterium]|jgi:uncharacterized protein YcgI (DUF1989 family)|nr:DUF1989 domain-containing protein [Solirubrobacterales bacterium]HMX71000.1 DUF1989 domain-containing protein [Solirubrobacterales bacterium]HMY25337.1 DUF1989 domain-containing protein [Solirubrobacterales bacterium]HNA25040.1 DUF1989 domain-containing protein [Solirubrobacterales bacterium]HNA43764.1 DUF1989 domain-containing protein [Solirubrobacterales bacterium]